MTREQMDRFAEMVLGPPRRSPGEVFIHPDGEPELLRDTDPPFFAKVLMDRPAFTKPPKPDGVHRRRPIPESVRREVLARDGSWCYLCGSHILMDGLHYDHIIPVSRGGANTADNIGVACAACNLRKHDQLTTKRPSALRGTVAPSTGEATGQ